MWYTRLENLNSSFDGNGKERNAGNAKQSNFGREKITLLYNVEFQRKEKKGPLRGILKIV